MRIKVFSQNTLFFTMILFSLFLYLSIDMVSIAIRLLYSTAFILFLIAERKKARLWIKLVLIGVLASPIYLMITAEIKFVRICELHRSTLITIQEKIAEDDVRSLRTAFENFRGDGSIHPIAKLLYDLQNPSVP